MCESINAARQRLCGGTIPAVDINVNGYCKSKGKHSEVEL